jgi:type IV secretory pathway VirB10-like protein
MLGDYDPLSSYQADMQAMTNMYASNMPGLPTGISPATASPPNPAQANGSDVYNKGQLQSPKSPYQVMAGTLIAASLVTGLNSDLPGHVIGQVTENVYDTVSGRHLLIPQGAKLIGSYESRNRYVRAMQSSGQDSINMAGQRVIDRSINVEPTITIRPGWRFSVLVTRDLLLTPYSN